MKKGFKIYEINEEVEVFEDLILESTDFLFCFFENEEEAINFLEFRKNSEVFYDEEILDVFEEYEEEIAKILREHKIDLKQFQFEEQERDEIFMPSISELKVLFFRKAWELTTCKIIEKIEKKEGNENEN